ncbi:UDP-2,3-diacylglucosamine hydrolase [Neisseria arctica]|uniref:UDP-2,3-diacylglucosamine hydrolase n=1 Tax=Neisseria arctica TaxID=1470200 RepID=A0A0J0YTY1_9NEIS|nr:UDP-2,3-diacylglucosamine diphosphatase [Neisseria arctica]KLT73560.1 UDP-2,3-diacylglucosamine hydrolase [Neisseria arctica]UOO86125.1 UDP-2,3-diacylglucosamine diphosphatase [Neisseria arctica]
MNTQTIFISDLHLSADVPELNELFFHSLAEWRGKIDALYILGDFFDVWVGDDDENPFINSVVQALVDFTAETPVFIQHGNRDFLLGNAFAEKSGVQMLPEQYIAEIYGKPYLLVHGDELCTDDLAYQQFRLQSRNPMWQAAVLAKSLAERRMLAGQIRMMSEIKKAEDGKSEISDATEAGIQALLSQHRGKGIEVLIHGHTHRPAVHVHETEEGCVHRYVLQDWENGKGGYLSITSDGKISMHLLEK